MYAPPPCLEHAKQRENDNQAERNAQQPQDDRHVALFRFSVGATTPNMAEGDQKKKKKDRRGER